MKLQKFFILTAFAAASTLSYTAHAAPEIVLTQTSDTDLSATINGSSLGVLDLGSDHWFVYGFGAALINGSAQWSDPDAAGDVNTVGSSFFSDTYGLGLDVHADAAPGGGPQLGNNTDDTTDFSYLAADFLPVNVTFNDLGDPSNVPDATTTMPLLGAAAGALFGLARRMRK